MRLLISNFIFLLLTFLGSFCAPVYSAMEVRASVDRTAVLENEPVLLSIVVENGSGTESIQIPENEAYLVQSYGTSNQTSIINGQISRSIQYNYQLTPRKTGMVLIPEIRVSADGQVFKTEPITLQVQTDQEQQNSDAKKSAVSPEDVIVELQMDKTTLVVDEPTVLHFRLLVKDEVNLQSPQYDPPALKDFLSEPYGKQRNGSLSRMGINYQVVELNTLLYPTKAGSFEVGPANISGQILKRNPSNRRNRSRNGFNSFDDLFGGALFDNDPFSNGGILQIPLNRKTNILNVTVKPLPDLGKPANFSGTVGHYKMNVVTTDLQHLKKGDAITLTVTIEGSGHVASIAEPHLENLQGFKTFESEVQVAPWIDEGQIAGKKTFKKIIVPEKSGLLKLPSIQFDFFDPVTDSYQTQVHEGVNIQVQDVLSDPNAGKVYESPSTQITSPVLKKDNIQMLGQDILFSRPDASFLKPTSTDFSWAFLAIFCSSLTFLYGVVFWIVQRARRLRNDPALLRGQGAYKQFKAHLSKIPKKNPQREHFSALQTTLSDYIANKLNLPGASLTPKELEEKLLPLGISETLCLELRATAESLDTLQYGMKRTEAKEWDQLIGKASQIVEKIENSWGKIKK